MKKLLMPMLTYMVLTLTCLIHSMQPKFLIFDDSIFNQKPPYNFTESERAAAIKEAANDEITLEFTGENTTLIREYKTIQFAITTAAEKKYSGIFKRDLRNTPELQLIDENDKQVSESRDLHKLITKIMVNYHNNMLTSFDKTLS